MREEFKPFIKMVDFLGEILGDYSEVVLHDLTNPNHSIIAIKNGHVTGRTVGGPVTNLITKIIEDNETKKEDYLCRYNGYVGDKQLQSSTFFVTDKDEKIIGMLCVNTDIETLAKTRDFLESMIGKRNHGLDEVTERLNMSIDEVAIECINKVITKRNIQPEKMTQQDKIEIVKILHDNGIFMLKGAVPHIANALKISEPSVYRYLSQIKYSMQNHLKS